MSGAKSGRDPCENAADVATHITATAVASVSIGMPTRQTVTQTLGYTKIATA